MSAWLWPDRVIGKRESRRLRDEHNALYNSHHRLLEALEATLPALIALGDYIGNEYPGAVGIPAFDRCALIGNARDAIERARA